MMWELPSKDNKQRWRRRAMIASPAIAALMVVFILTVIAHPKPDNYPIYEVRSGHLIDAIRVGGEMVPDRPVRLTARVGGVVSRIMVRDGGRVEQGETLIELMNAETKWAARQGRFDLEQARIEKTLKREQLHRELRQMRSKRERLALDLKEARLALTAKDQLFEKHIISELDYKRARFKVNKLEQRFAASKADIASFERSMENQLLALDDKIRLLKGRADLNRKKLNALQIVSPVNGIVKDLSVTRGSFISAGEMLAQVFSPEELVPRIRLPESYSDAIEPSQHVRIEIDQGYISGRIARIEPAVSDGYIGAYIQIDQPLPDSFNRPNRSFEAEVILADIDDTLMMDRPPALHPGHELTVYKIARREGMAHKTTLRLGVRTLNEVQILSGAEPGDRLIVNPPEPFQDDDVLELE